MPTFSAVEVGTILPTSACLRTALPRQLPNADLSSEGCFENVCSRYKHFYTENKLNMVLFTLIAIFSILSFSIKSKRGARYFMHRCSDLAEIKKVLLLWYFSVMCTNFFRQNPFFKIFDGRLTLAFFLQKWKIAIKHRIYI